MMKLIAPALIAGVFGAAGGAAAVYLKAGSSAPAQASSHGDEGSAGAKEDKGHGDKPEKDAHGEDKGHGGKAKGGHGSASGEGMPSYYKFSREFVVPIVGTERVKSLVILNLNLEVDESASQDLFSREPALRDNIMTTLISLSADDEIFNSLNSIEHYETIRSMILANLQDSFGHGVKNVLILDMARQDL